MGRGLSNNAKNYVGPHVWAVALTLRSGTTYNFAEDDMGTFLGATYQPYLRMNSPVQIFRSARPASADIELVNTDLVVGNLIKTASFSGAQAILKVLLLGIEEEVEITRGLLSEPVQRQEAVAFHLTGEPDLGQLDTLGRQYAQLCTWRFAIGPCGYRNTAITVTEQIAERTATAVGTTTIEDNTLAMTASAHKDRAVLITSASAARMAVRRIRDNTATRFDLYQPWKTKPTGTVKFKVFSHTNGLPKGLTTAGSAFFERTATGGAARYIEDTGLALVLNEHAAQWVYIRTGTGAGQLRKIGDNTTGGRFNLDATAADFAPAPDGSSVFQALYATCDKDLFESCEQRGRYEEFNGFPSLVLPVVRNVNRVVIT